MQLRFNDGTTLAIQKATELGGGLQVLIAGITPEKLRELFTDSVKTVKMTVTERGQVIEEYENYTEFYRTEEYTGKIYGVVVNQVGKSTEERLSDVEGDVETVKKDVEEIKESGGIVPENYGAVFAMAKMSAEKITDDEQALKVADLYDAWSGASVAYKTGKYLTYQDVLYKVLKDHTSQETWTPDTASSLYAKVLTDPSGEVLPWEQPQSTNGYKKGDRVTHKGKTWESLVDSNVWEPGAVGSESLWKEVKEE